MIYISLVGGDEFGDFAGNFNKVLEMCGCSYIYSPGTGLIVHPECCQNPDFMIFCADTPMLITGSSPLITVFLDGFTAGAITPSQLCCIKYAVLEPQNTKAAALLSKTDISAITCGMSDLDTMTFSSMNQRFPIATLQRSLIALDGSVIDPREVRLCPVSGLSLYPSLAAAACVLISGKEMQGQ